MVAIANVEMAAIWDGEEGDEWIENADRYDATDRWIDERFEAETCRSNRTRPGPRHRVRDRQVDP